MPLRCRKKRRGWFHARKRVLEVLGPGSLADGYMLSDATFLADLACRLNIIIPDSRLRYIRSVVHGVAVVGTGSDTESSSVCL